MARKASFKSAPRDTRLELKKDVKTHFDKLPKTSFMFIDEYILINVHLTSKPKENASQLQHLRDALKKLKEIHPSSHIICGGDVNS